MRFGRILSTTAIAFLVVTFATTFTSGTVHAAAPESCTWTGAVGLNFSTPGNWTGCSGAAPVDGDSLDFPYGTGVTNKFVNNDLPAGLSVNSITLSGNYATESGGLYVLSGNSINLSGGINETANEGFGVNLPLVITADQTFNMPNFTTIGGVISGSGNITKNGNDHLVLEANNTFTGNLVINGGVLAGSRDNALGSSAGSTTINAGANLKFVNCYNDNFNLAENITFNGPSFNSVVPADYPQPKFTTGAGDCAGSGGYSEKYGLIVSNGLTTLSGTITLGADLTIGSVGNTTITGALTGGAYKITTIPGYTGSVIINSSSNTIGTPNSTLAAAPFVLTLSDNAPTNDVTVSGNEVISIDGSRGDVAVGIGGVLKGTGTLGALTVDSGATVAPGHSPGCLSTTSIDLSGTYEAEIGGTSPCTGYDQIQVKAGGTAKVGGVLKTSLYGGFVPVIGQSYTIVDNASSNPTTGTFTGLSEGATFVSQGVTFKISYVGGTGNDVVITVVTVNAAALPSAAPKAPNTGFALVSAHPVFSLLISAIASIILLLAARQMQPAKMKSGSNE
jgi:fibronectin-binding autotransporter adhesin